MTDIADFIHENKLDAMRLGGQVLGAGRERHIKVFNPCLLYTSPSPRD